jgi:hypothetical protein
MLRCGPKRKAAQVDTVDTVQSEKPKRFHLHPPDGCRERRKIGKNGGNTGHGALIAERRAVGKSTLPEPSGAFK